MYADGCSCSHTTLRTIYSLCNTHIHTPSVLLMWLMDKLQRSDTFGWVTEPEGSLFKKLWEDFYSCSSLQINLSYTLLPSAARSKSRSLTDDTCPVFIVTICRSEHMPFWKHLAHQPFDQEIILAQSWRWECVFLNHHNTHLWGG